MLHWKLAEPPMTSAQLNVAFLSATKKKPPLNLDHWDLGDFISVASTLNVVSLETVTAANLARGYCNLIHPGRAARLAQVCDRATAFSAIAGLEHVIRDLS
jgi:hypothetical protein